MIFITVQPLTSIDGAAGLRVCLKWDSSSEMSDVESMHSYMRHLTAV